MTDKEKKERKNALLQTLADLWKEHKRLDAMRWSSFHRQMLVAVDSEIEDVIKSLKALQ